MWLRCGGGRTVSSEDSALDRILRSLNNPIRRRILRALRDQPGSASSLAQEFEMELSRVSYHLNHVLAEDCNAVDLIKMVPRRGSVEKVYLLNRRLWSDFSGVCQSEPVSGSLPRLTLGECLLAAVAALDGDAFAELDGSAWEWFLAEVDMKAWKTILAARKEFKEQLEAAIKESRERGQGKPQKTHTVIVGPAAFPATGLS